MQTRSKSKGPILCARDGLWKLELERRLKTNESVTLMALGTVKNELLAYLNKRKDIEIIRMETRYMKKREKGLGLKVIISRKEKLAS
ncbi:MAG: hypothetical protein QXL57_04290 [Candidatus Bathyarchaeia archaeon]